MGGLRSSGAEPGRVGRQLSGIPWERCPLAWTVRRSSENPAGRNALLDKSESRIPALLRKASHVSNAHSEAA